jgi:hypothetical protein
MVTTMAFKAGEYEILRHMNKLNPRANAYFYSLDYVGRWSLYNFLFGIDMYIPGGISHTVLEYNLKTHDIHNYSSIWKFHNFFLLGRFDLFLLVGTTT